MSSMYQPTAINTPPCCMNKHLEVDKYSLAVSWYYNYAAIDS